jgi:methyl-accepting chemotaxis protein
VISARFAGADSTPVAADSSLLGQVTSLRDSTEEVFLSTGTQLIEVATLLDAARAAAQSLDQLAKVDLIDRFRVEADSQSGAFETLAADFAVSRTGIQAATSALRKLDHAISDVRRSIVTMRIVVLNARVNLASLSAEDQSLSSFAEGGQAVVAVSTDLLVRLETALSVIQIAVEKTETMVDRIGGALTTSVLGAFKVLMTDVSSFEGGIHDIRDRGAELSRKLQDMLDATRHAVTGLQVGDSTRQQLDHVIAILSRPEGQQPALQSLAAELLRNAAQTHSVMLDQLRASMAEMTNGLSDLVDTHLRSFFGSNGPVVDAETLLDGSARLTHAIEALHPLQDETRKLSEAMAVEFEAFRGLILEGEGVQESALMIGINAVLSCRRMDQGSAALKVVAEQLQVVSREVGERFAAIRTILDRVSTLGGEITSGTDRLVRQSIDVPKKLSGSIGPMINAVAAHLEPAQQAIARLHERLAGLAFDFGPALKHSHQLSDLAADLSAPARPMQSDQVPDATLAEIYAMFTIEREREIFRLVLPDRVAAASATGFSAPSMEMDDGFLL